MSYAMRPFGMVEPSLQRWPRRSLRSLRHDRTPPSARRSGRLKRWQAWPMWRLSTLMAHTYEGNPPRREHRVWPEARQMQDDTVAGHGVIDIPAEVITGAVIHVGLDRSAIEAKVIKARLMVIGRTVLEVMLAIFGLFWAVRPFVRRLSDTNQELETNVRKLQET